MHDIHLSGEEILARQLELAEENYKLLKEKGIRAISVMGAIGSGKTTLIEKIVERIKPCGYTIGAIAGDTAGDDDHRRFLAHGIHSVNLNTQDDCHLDAHRVSHALEDLPLDDIDILFIENVGNLVCPADFPLGADVELVVISVTEGDDMIRKYPKIFAQTDLIAINKIDLADAVGVDPQVLVSDYKKVNPHGRAILTDAKHNRGIDKLIRALSIECTNTQW